MAAKYAIKIGTSINPAETLPTPDEMVVSLQTLDSAKSGRNNNTGKMFRDKVAEKLTIKLTMPYGIDNTKMASIMSIIKTTSFYCSVIDPRTATYNSKGINVYCASVEPDIAEITEFNAAGTPTKWIYESFELTFVEM